MMLLIAASLASSVGLVDLFSAYGVAVYPFGYIGGLGYLFVIGRVATRYCLVDMTPSEMAGQIMASMMDGLVVIDRNGIARLANAAAKRMFRGDPINRHIGEVPVVGTLEGELRRSLAERKPCALEVSDVEAGATYSVSTAVMYDPQADPFARPLIAKGKLRGFLRIVSRGQPGPDSEWLGFFEALALELRDIETEGHSRRVSAMSARLAQSMGVEGEALVHLRRGDLPHDIGTMGVPDSILFKRGPLDEDEWKLMRRHPVIAFEMLHKIPFLRQAIDIPYCHHGKWDGSGYPRSLRREQIPFAARIFRVVDVWDALRSNRTYRDGWPEASVREYITSPSGKDFDPEVVEHLGSLDWQLP